MSGGSQGVLFSPAAKRVDASRDWWRFGGGGGARMGVVREGGNTWARSLQAGSTVLHVVAEKRFLLT